MLLRSRSSFILGVMLYLTASCGSQDSNHLADLMATDVVGNDSHEVASRGDDVDMESLDSHEVLADLLDPDTSTTNLDSIEDLNAGPLSVTRLFPETLPQGIETSIAFLATGGTPPYGSWTLQKGALPTGLELNEATGVVSGTPTEEGLSLFVLRVEDSQSNAAERFLGLIVGSPEVDGVLRTRARNYQTIYEERHLWHGLSYGLKTPDDPDGNYGLTTLGDTTFVSGNCTMAMAYRAAVLDTPEALAVVRKQVEGWRFFEALTGVKGLLGRSYGRLDDPWEEDHATCWYPECNRHQGTGEFEGWIWVGDVSRDQMAGAVLGLGAVCDLIDDPAIKASAAEFLTNLVDHLHDNDMALVDSDGEPTTYGDLNGNILEGWPLPNGLNAVVALSWFKLAATVSDDPKYQEYYNELAYDQGYPDAIQENMWVYAGYGTKWYNTYMAYEGFFHLMRLEDDSFLAQRYRELFRRTLWSVTGEPTPNRGGEFEHNPVKTTWYLYSTGLEDPTALYDAAWMIRDFPDAPLRDRKIQNSLDPDIEVNPDAPTEALTPIPISKRIADMVMWHRGPYKLDGGEDSGEERTGCDYLLPYWMGRYYGFIGPNW